MPVSPNNLQFSLSSEYLDKLKARSKDGESLGLTAKRVLIEALDQSNNGEVVSTSYLKERIEAIEIAIEAEYFPLRSEREVVSTDYESRLAALEVSNQDIRSEVEGLRRLFYQFTSPVKKR